MSTVAIVEDHRLVADMLVTALAERGIEAVPVPCGRAPSREEDPVLTRILATHPDLVLLDLDLGAAGDGVELIGPLTAAGLRVLVVTGVDDPLHLARALEAGAIDYQAKADGFAALLAATCAALDGAAGLDEVRRRRLLHDLRVHRERQSREFAPFEQLTDREREVLEALAEGRSVRDIAADWTVSDTTIRAHVRGILAKLGTSSQLGAVGAALRSGWLHRNRG